MPGGRGDWKSAAPGAETAQAGVPGFSRSPQAVG